MRSADTYGQSFNGMTVSNDLRVFTADGPLAAGDRVRIHHWIKRGAISPEIHTFAQDLPFGRSGRYLRHPLRTIEAHRRVSFEARRKFTGTSVVYRQVSPFSRGSLEQQALRRSGFGVFDFDDALHLDKRKGVGALLAPAVKAQKTVEWANRVVAGNEFLAEWAADFCRDVVTIPSCVEPEEYEQKSDYSLSASPRIGWIGSWSTEPYLDDVADSLLIANKEFGAKLIIVGAVGTVRPRLEAIVERHVWSETSANLLAATFDVGIMPLASSPYEHGKCGYKLLQYGAAGVPVIGSPVGTNKSILRRFEASAPVTTREWSDSLLDLLGATSEERHRLGARARSIVQRDFSYQRWQDEWVSAITGVDTHGPDPRRF